MDSPALFSDVILIDPVIRCPPFADAIGAQAMPLSLLSATVGRRVEFPSRCVRLLSCRNGLISSCRAAALESFIQVPFFSQWDRRVLQAYVDLGMIEDEVNGVTRLKTSGYQVGHDYLDIYIYSTIHPRRPQCLRKDGLSWRCMSCWINLMIESSCDG
jgi:hypothetical protein